MITLNINGRKYTVNVAADATLLWVIREHLKLTGTKYGCGAGICGCCTVQINGKAVKSCQVKASDAAGKKILTIEGLPDSHPVKSSWIEEQVPQCGYCQPGQVMRAAALLDQTPNPSDDRIVKEMSENLCRCGTYPRILSAVKKAARKGGRS